MNTIHTEPKRILFICTGNYYRSRFAEAVFNFSAMENKLNWTATSRGLATYLVGDDNFLSGVVTQALRDRNIPASFTSPLCRQISEQDFWVSDTLIAIDRAEHRPLMDRYYHDWVDKVTYWDISDVGELSPENAIPRIEKNVHELIRSLSPSSPHLTPSLSLQPNVIPRH